MKNLILISTLFAAGTLALVLAGTRRKRKKFKIESQKLKILKFGDEKSSVPAGFFVFLQKNICFFNFSI